MFWINISTFAILFIFNGDFRVFSENRKFMERLKELKMSNVNSVSEEEIEEEQSKWLKSF